MLIKGQQETTINCFFVVDMDSVTSGLNTLPEFKSDNPGVMFDEYVEILQEAKNGDVTEGNARTSRCD